MARAEHAGTHPADIAPEDLPHLRRCVELAAEAVDVGDRPFGSVLVAADGRALAEERNREVSTGDPTRHPEFDLARWAAANMTAAERAGATVFTSGEHWYGLAAAQGNLDAQYRLGVMYESGVGVSTDLVHAGQWYRKAAEQGHAASALSLGQLYARGEGVKKSNRLALQWIRKSADLGNKGGMELLGQIYENGWLGLPANPTEARKWYVKAKHAKGS